VPEEVASFWRAFATFRDSPLVADVYWTSAFREVLALRLEDLSARDAHLRVLGKGNKNALCRSAESIEVLEKNLRLGKDRSPFLFPVVSLKGRSGGGP